MESVTKGNGKVFGYAGKALDIGMNIAKNDDDSFIDVNVDVTVGLFKGAAIGGAAAILAPEVGAALVAFGIGVAVDFAFDMYLEMSDGDSNYSFGQTLEDYLNDSYTSLDEMNDIKRFSEARRKNRNNCD